MTVNTLVILVVIVIVLGGLYLYAQNKKQAALLQGLTPAIAAIMAPFKAALAPQPMAVAPTPQTASLAQPPAVRVPEPAAGSDGRQPVALIEAK
jgi:chromate transport protein ChrA